MICAAGMLNWSLISFINLTTSLVLRFSAPKRGTSSLYLDLNKATYQSTNTSSSFCFVVL